MENLTKEQKGVLYEVIKREKPELMPILDALETISTNIKAIADRELPINERPEVQKIEIPGVELITIKGKDLKYEDLTDAQRAELKGEPGEDGDDYTLTEADKKSIAKSITVPIVEKIIEKTEVIHEQPIVTNEVKEVAVADTAEQVRDKLETLKENARLDVSAIKGLDDKFGEVDKKIASIPRGGARASNSMKLQPLTADGATKTFLVPKSVSGFLLCSDSPSPLMENNGFTINATRTQVVITTENAPSYGAQLLWVYSSVFNT